MTERVEQWICVKFCVKLAHSSAETIQMIQKATAKGNWRLAALSWQCTHSYITSPAEFFGKISNHPAPYSPELALQLLAFPKTKIAFEREEISDHWWDSGKFNGAGSWWQLGELCEVPQVPTLKGTEASFPMYNVSCFLYLVSYSINVSIFHITWLDTFWTDLAYIF